MFETSIGAITFTLCHFAYLALNALISQTLFAAAGR